MAGGLGVALSLVGTAVSASSQMSMVAKQEAASTRAENAREQQMQLDATRRRRQAVRQSILARATALATGTSQGAAFGSGVAGATGGAVAQGLENQQGVNASETIGSRIFDANRDYFKATSAGQFGMALGSGISAMGGALVSNAGTINKLGQNLSGGAPA